jgi:hypothetical protein
MRMEGEYDVVVIGWNVTRNLSGDASLDLPSVRLTSHSRAFRLWRADSDLACMFSWVLLKLRVGIWAYLPSPCSTYINP